MRNKNFMIPIVMIVYCLKQRDSFQRNFRVLYDFENYTYFIKTEII